MESSPRPRALTAGMRARTRRREAGSGGHRAAGMAGPAWGPPRLDGFILTERLGSGTYATVYKAYAKVGAGQSALGTPAPGRDGAGEPVRARPLCPPDPERARMGVPRERGEMRRASSGPRPAALRWRSWELTATLRF